MRLRSAKSEGKRKAFRAPLSLQRTPDARDRQANDLPGWILGLQQTHGNQFVQRLIQTKLNVSQPGDRYEREADRVSHQILQRESAPCACGGSCPKCCGDRSGPVQRQSETRKASSTAPVPEDLLGGLGPGSPLGSSTRAFFEPRFGADFSHVRVHTGANAAESARAVNARAFTLGRDVVFGADQYAPTTSPGQKLLAHELTHVVQQQHDPQPASAVQRQTDAGDYSNCEVIMVGGGMRTICPPRRAGTQKAKTATRYRINNPTHPGWVDVEPTYLLVKAGEPFELPHFVEVQEESRAASRKLNVTILEGRYKGKDADVDRAELARGPNAQSAATAKFDLQKGEIWYGGNGPVQAKTDPDNPVPTGTHDIEIPDYQHSLGSGYGDFGTTWFRLGHSGDRYLHPGQVSLGCATVTETTEWPNIWQYLIRARKDQRSVGELEVV